MFHTKISAFCLYLEELQWRQTCFVNVWPPPTMTGLAACLEQIDVILFWKLLSFHGDEFFMKVEEKICEKKSF